jgi:glycosyltransferase involved in cell wall biosynthesis
MLHKRQILMICPYLPRLSQSGGQRHSYYTLKYLAPKNDVTLICISPDQDGLEEIRPFCRKIITLKRRNTWSLKNILSTGFGRYPFLLTKYISSDLQKAIQSELNNHRFDLIHCDCLYPMPNIPKTNIPIVLVDVTIEYAIYQHFIDTLTGLKKIIAPILAIDVLKLKYWETRYWKNTHTVVMFSADDQKFVSKVTKRQDIKIFLDGVDPKYFNIPKKSNKSRFPSILFGVSNMKWMQNRESVELIMQHHWPKIHQAYPSAKLYIIGRFAPEFFAKYASENIIVAEADSEGGPHDPQYYYEHSWLLLAPMGSGGGTRNKFLEGMSLGLPVITTPEGGMGSIQFTNFQDAIVCPSSQIFTHVKRLIDDKAYRQTISHNARKLIKDNYSFDRCVEGLNHIYDSITAKKLNTQSQNSKYSKQISTPNGRF